MAAGGQQPAQRPRRSGARPPLTRYRAMSPRRGAAPTGRAPESVRSLVETVSLVVAPFTALIALLYYFGWVRTGAIFGRFGIEQRLLGFSREDYLLRSAGVAFRPTAALLLAAFLAFAGYRLLQRVGAVVSVRHHQQMAVAASIAGLLMIGWSAAVLFGVLLAEAPLAAAASLSIGTLVAEAGATMRESGRAPVMRRFIVVSTVLVSCFWAFAVYAQQTGTRLADSWAANPKTRPAITVHSRENLSLSGPGVVEHQSQGDEAYAYRYTGLRLLIFSNNRWFLLPERWAEEGNLFAYIVTDSNQIRVETAPPG